mmetsp:Transcript_20966/g.42571  ORF Transcript_20966/g.42571 Transcript_20966/m.42571 type:complete len:557 (-) Transcript_20966:85-1755(-)
MSFLGFGHPREQCCHNDEKQIHFFKSCIEEVKSQYPHLNNYALHQKAKELFAKEIGRELLASQTNRRHSEKRNIFNDVFSKLRFGKPKKDVGSDEERANYECNNGYRKNSDCFSGDPEDEMNSRARRSIAPRKSVALPSELHVDRADLNMLRNLYGEFDDSDQSFNASVSSLARSLDGIEQSWNIGGASRRYSAGSAGSRNVVRRASRRVSGASIELTGVKEEGDDELYDVMIMSALSEKRISLNAGDSNSVMKSSNSSLRSKSLKKANSISESLPDEIKLTVSAVSDKFAMMQNANVSSTEEKESGFSDSVSLRSSDVFRDSGVFTRSLSSENFEGDFSAWRDSFRFSCKKPHSQREGSSLEVEVKEESTCEEREIPADESKESHTSSENGNKASIDKLDTEKRGFFQWRAINRLGKGKSNEGIQNTMECDNSNDEGNNIEGIDSERIPTSSTLPAEKARISMTHRRGTTHDSFESSMSSTDSKNFTGDFSAWRDSFKKLPKVIDDGLSNGGKAFSHYKSEFNCPDIVNMHQSNSSCLTIDEENFSEKYQNQRDE